MTDFLTPYGFVQAVAEIRDAGRTMWLYFSPSAYSCKVSPRKLRRTAGIRVGSFDALVLGPELARIMRLELGIVIERVGVPRGTRGQRLQSKSYRKNADNAGRRSV